MLSIIDLSAERIFYQLFAAIVVMATHGIFLVLAARLLGDRGPVYDGRQTLNPFAHAEPVGAFMLILTQFGWVRPVTLDPGQLKGGRIGPLVVAASALLATLALGWLLWQLRPVAFSVLTANSVGMTVIGLLETTARMSISFAVLNALPILPLSAGHLLFGLAPKVAARLEHYRLIAALVVAAIVFIWLGAALRGPISNLSRLLFG